MKRRIPRIAPICRRERRDEGSVTLEAAMMMPIFMLFAMFLAFMVQTAVMTMALHGALSQTARQAAAAWYPIALAADKARDTELNRQIEQWNDRWQSVGETLREYGRWLPAPMNEWAEQAADVTFSVEEQAAILAFGRMMESFVDERVLDVSRIRLTSVGLPDVDDRSRAFLTLQAEYALPMEVPLLGRKLVIKQAARERAWIGGSPSSSRQAKEDGEQPFNVAFVSLEPNPVRPGRKATLVLRTDPGATVDLSILYKSGPSQAKHLGSATADESGLVSWTWHVSGRTTPGIWSWKVANEEGAAWQQTFEVAGKGAAGSEGKAS
ncbi:TadE/TadG family type IV pilus assembly protein [Paenibacillaceae bacterium WGS1546]|uniref:TadE/TadG family type IV pilus assembly protein n=1 Tax=Cohnella sp. WGS1546 TaxID=3366810 RepID=UPI00372D3CFE